MPEQINPTQAVEFLSAAQDVLILTHSSPDGDTLGSAYALCRALQLLGKRARVECSDPIDKKYQFLQNNILSQEFAPQTVVAVDIADPRLLGDRLSVYADKVDLSIDHHCRRNLFARQTLVEPGAAAAAEIVLRVIEGLGVPPDRDIAACVYTAIATDTGCFKYSNTTAQSHRIAAKMMEQGIDFAAINREMFETKTLSRLELERLALERLEFFFDARCALICITREMRQSSGASDADMEGITGLPRQIEGVLAGVTMRERDDGIIRISVRTRDGVDASRICAQMGGGGHKNAAGCQAEDGIESAKARIVDIIARELNAGAGSTRLQENQGAYNAGNHTN